MRDSSMGAFHLRPPVDELVFQLYGRPLHPELFDILAVRTIERNEFTLRVWITPSGHVITFENPDVFLCEVTATSDQPLPEGRRLMRYRLRNEHSSNLCCAHGISYQMSFQVEVLAPEIYEHVHEEILADGRKRGLLSSFPSSSRVDLAPLGYISAETRPGCLMLSSFHTFPTEYTVVKTQSLIERSPA